MTEPPRSARKWEIGAAPAFLQWQDGLAVGNMISFARAVHRTITSADWGSPLADVASQLPRVLAQCDNLTFDSDTEVRAYAALHLVDRYGRVLQVLEHLFRVGRLPLRHWGIAALEVGSGPAPALYAIHDFYEDLIRWPARGDWAPGPLRICDALDKAPGWNWFLHPLSEALIAERHTRPQDGALPFGRALADFTGLDVHAVHQASIASLAASIEAEFDQAGEPVSWATALRWAEEQGTDRPSGYDLVFVPNFLTRSDALQLFQTELRGLMRSLTLGGVFVALCGIGRQYTEIRSGLEALAAHSGLTAVGPPGPVTANAERTRHATVTEQVRAVVSAIMSASHPEQRESLRRQLPRDLVDGSVAFKLPKFRALAFVNQPRPRKSRRPKAEANPAS